MAKKQGVSERIVFQHALSMIENNILGSIIRLR